MLASKLLSACGGTETLYSDDCFATVTRTGTGATATITTGFQPDLVWIKARSTTGSNVLYDSARGFAKTLVSETTAAQVDRTGFDTLTAGSTGYTINTGWSLTNGSGTTYVDWVFSKKAKFFDCGTYTGNGVAGRQIPHSLGVSPGMVIVKATSAAGYGWAVWHRSLSGNDQFLRLDSTIASSTSVAYWNNTAPTSSNFTVGTGSLTNDSGIEFVWYAFAHDPSAEGIIQCGSFTTTGSGEVSVNLGWEPQFLLVKSATYSGADGIRNAWNMADSMRGLTADGVFKDLRANLSSAETDVAYLTPTATGFKASGNFNAAAGETQIYIAIRRPNKPPTTGTQVYNAIARTGTGAAATVTGVGFAPDLVHSFARTAGINHLFFDRLRGATNKLYTSATNAESADAPSLIGFDSMDGVRLGLDNVYGGINFGSTNYINHFFKRAPGVFDICAYTGTGSARTVNHSLGVAPELIFTKARNQTASWMCHAVAQNLILYLNSNYEGDANSGKFGTHTATGFNVSDTDGIYPSNAELNTQYIAYLWASSPGISKVTSVTKSSGSSLNVDCGFSSGARFVMLKRTGASGDWYVWDSVRGIVSASDPFLLLNSTAAENTSTDYIDPYSAGFTIVDGGLANGTYLVLAYA